MCGCGLQVFDLREAKSEVNAGTDSRQSCLRSRGQLPKGQGHKQKRTSWCFPRKLWPSMRNSWRRWPRRMVCLSPRKVDAAAVENVRSFQESQWPGQEIQRRGEWSWQCCKKILAAHSWTMDGTKCNKNYRGAMLKIGLHKSHGVEKHWISKKKWEEELGLEEMKSRLAAGTLKWRKNPEDPRFYLHRSNEAHRQDKWKTKCPRSVQEMARSSWRNRTGQAVGFSGSSSVQHLVRCTSARIWWRRCKLPRKLAVLLAWRVWNPRSRWQSRPWRIEAWKRIGSEKTDCTAGKSWSIAAAKALHHVGWIAQLLLLCTCVGWRTLSLHFCWLDGHIGFYGLDSPVAFFVGNSNPI